MKTIQEPEKIDIALNSDTHEVFLRGVKLQAKNAAEAGLVFDTLCEMKWTITAFRAWQEQVEYLRAALPDAP